MMQPNSRGLAFLLSLGSLPIGCFKDEMNGTGGTSLDTTGSDSAAPTGSTGSGGPTTGAVTTSGSTGGSSTGGSTGIDETTAAVEGSTTGGSSSSSGEAGGEDDPQCIAYASKIVECVPRVVMLQQYYVDYCEASKVEGMQLDGEVCFKALEAYIVCVANATCPDFENDGPCFDASNAAYSACPNLYADDTGTGTD